MLGQGVDLSGAPGGAAPIFQLAGAQQFRLAEQLTLMLQRLIEPAQENPVLAHPGAVETGLRPALEVLQIRGPIRLELTEPGAGRLFCVVAAADGPL